MEKENSTVGEWHIRRATSFSRWAENIYTIVSTNIVIKQLESVTDTKVIFLGKVSDKAKDGTTGYRYALLKLSSKSLKKK